MNSSPSTRPGKSRLQVPWQCLFLLAALVLVACERPDPDVIIDATMAPLVVPPTLFPGQQAGEKVVAVPLSTPESGAIVDPSLPTYQGTPTPDPTRPGDVAPGGEHFMMHAVAVGETLSYIAQRYGSTAEELMDINALDGSDFLYVGQVLRVPDSAALTGPSFKIIPDSELVFGPTAREFDVGAFAARYNGYLLHYQEEVEEQTLSGPEVVELVAARYSVHPRLLLAALEFRSGWVTQSNPAEKAFPMQRAHPGFDGLYKQLGWAADRLNWGFYGRSEGGVSSFITGDTRVSFAREINDGTAGVQHWLGVHDGASYETWVEEVGPTGFFATYSRFFGNPFAYTYDPLLPSGLSQPAFALPWGSGETWYYTGGPHGGWASGSAWAALDFVPGSEQRGCYVSQDWVRAVAPGVVVRSSFGAVVVDYEGDGFAGDGWAVTYQHVATRDRAAVGTVVQTGDPLGHPSCEGGFSNGTHVHIARTYNGRWIAADGAIPFNLGGWESQGYGREYDGALVRGDSVKEACECRGDGNAITAD